MKGEIIMAGKTVTPIKAADVQPTAKSKMAKVSYTAEGQKGSFNVPIGTKICPYVYKNGETTYDDKGKLTNHDGTKIFGYCHDISQNTDIGQITPVQAKLFDLVRMKDGKSELTQQDLIGLRKLSRSTPGDYHDYIEKPFKGKVKLGLLGSGLDGNTSEIPTYIMQEVYSLASKKIEGIKVDLPDK